jgi:L-Ala-D/L-Glu epimerase
VIVDSLRASALSIPFRSAFKHAAAERAVTQSVLVEATSVGGTSGWGEGCPREYVTDETIASALAFIREQERTWKNAACDLDLLWDWTAGHAKQIDLNAAAWTAVELALLDLLGKDQNCSIEKLLDLPELQGTFKYTAVIGDAPSKEFEARLKQYIEAGFDTFKVKLAGDPMRDREKVSLLKAARVDSHCVRADANNVWTDSKESLRALSALDFPFVAVEEPLPAGDIDGMRELALALDTMIILDESVLREEQLTQAGELADRFVVNVRVSKMGGLLRSLNVVRRMRALGLSLIVGAHVGETSLLTRAALTIANSARDLLIAQEGAFGTHLLAFDATEHSVMFGAKGVLESNAHSFAAAPGLGLQMSSALRCPVN